MLESDELEPRIIDEPGTNDEIAPVILVCGFGRCGTSLVMQMLAAAGVDCAGRAPTYEEQIAPEHKNDAVYWYRTFAGRALKVLDPDRFRPPADIPYLVIWLDRDEKQQAASQVKFLQVVCGMKMAASTKFYVKKFAKQNRLDRPRTLAGLCNLAGPENCFRMEFERLIDTPHLAAAEIWSLVSRYSTRRFDNPYQVVLDMASVVRIRHSDNYPGLLEVSLPDFTRQLQERVTMDTDDKKAESDPIEAGEDPAAGTGADPGPIISNAGGVPDGEGTATDPTQPDEIVTHDPLTADPGPEPNGG